MKWAPGFMIENARHGIPDARGCSKQSVNESILAVIETSFDDSTSPINPPGPLTSANQIALWPAKPCPAIENLTPGEIALLGKIAAIETAVGVRGPRVLAGKKPVKAISTRTQGSLNVAPPW
jgi:hypothetical protein